MLPIGGGPRNQRTRACVHQILREIDGQCGYLSLSSWFSFRCHWVKRSLCMICNKEAVIGSTSSGGSAWVCPNNNRREDNHNRWGWSECYCWFWRCVSCRAWTDRFCGNDFAVYDKGEKAESRGIWASGREQFGNTNGQINRRFANAEKKRHFCRRHLSPAILLSEKERLRSVFGAACRIAGHNTKVVGAGVRSRRRYEQKCRGAVDGIFICTGLQLYIKEKEFTRTLRRRRGACWRFLWVRKDTTGSEKEAQIYLLMSQRYPQVKVLTCHYCQQGHVKSVCLKLVKSSTQ